MKKWKITVVLMALILVLVQPMSAAAAGNDTLGDLLEQGKEVVNGIVENVKSMLGSKFSDTGSHWAKTYIEQLVAKGAIKGYTDGTFRPNNNITRAEFISILLRAMGNDPGQPKTGKWYDNYIKEAKAKGYIKEGEFANVEQNISRMEVVKVITRALGKEDTAVKLSGVATKLTDDNTISNANKGYVRVCYEYGIISGTSDGKFLPNANATRAEAAKMIITFLENKGKNIEIPVDVPKDDGVYINGEKVETDYPQLLPHIKKAMEIAQTKDGYFDIDYSSKYNQVEFFLYKSKEEFENEYWQRHGILGYVIYPKKDPAVKIYHPYSICLWDTENELGRNKFKEFVKDFFPEAYDTVTKELENKIKDINYEKKLITKIGNREIKIITEKGAKGMSIYAGL